MGGHLSVWGNRTLGQLTLPASHDAGMYLSGFPQSLGRTQSLSIYQQLTAGVRWFDLRPESKGGKFYIHHGSILGPDLDVVLNDVRRFMAEGHHELVLLKFSHFDGINAGNYPAMTRQMRDALSPWLYENLPAGKRLGDITLADFVRDHGRVVILCDGGLPVVNKQPGIWCYRDWENRDPQNGDLCVYDQYSNSTSFETMKADQLSKFAAFDGKCRQKPEVPCDLFLLSWTLTPPTGVISFSQKANAQLGDVMEHIGTLNSHGRRINQVYVDDAGEWLTKVVVKMNCAIINCGCG
jgi:hypothetical protein